MKLVRVAWKLLVAVKDGLVLALLLLFFGLLFAALNASPGSRPIGEGALLLKLDGPIVEQPTEPGSLVALSSSRAPRQFRLRDLVRAIDAAGGDARVKAIVLDLDGFAGAYPSTLNQVAEALRRARGKGKPVLAYASSYTDGAYRLAAAANEIWMDPFGEALFRGPGGAQLYYKGLIDRLGVDVHVFRVGRYKEAVEPLIDAGQSPAAREARTALYGALLEQYRQGIAAARPRARIDGFLTDPVGQLTAAGGNLAVAGVRAGIVDKLASRLDFDKRVAQLAGAESGKGVGAFRTIRYDDYVGQNLPKLTGDAIGVITVAGNIVDGRAGPGTAAGDTINDLILNGLADKKLKALVVRIDSGGGSVTASERIRQAVLQAKAQGLPVVVSMGGIAASGGYWVATAGDTIFAEPQAITGSIGIFGILPTFEGALAKIGITSDGVRTTPLSGQPDLYGGITPAVAALYQAGINRGYMDFIGRVAASRHMTPERVDQIGQGRIWDGGTARQLGLVDRFGTLDDALAEAARRAKLATWHAEYLEKKPGWLASLAASFNDRDEDEDASAIAPDLFARAALERRQLLVQALGDVRRLAVGGPMQARCMECAALGPVVADPSDQRLLDLLLARIGLGG